MYKRTEKRTSNYFSKLLSFRTNSIPSDEHHFFLNGTKNACLFQTINGFLGVNNKLLFLWEHNTKLLFFVSFPFFETNFSKSSFSCVSFFRVFPLFNSNSSAKTPTTKKKLFSKCRFFLFYPLLYSTIQFYPLLIPPNRHNIYKMNEPPLCCVKNRKHSSTDTTRLNELRLLKLNEPLSKAVRCGFGERSLCVRQWWR